MRLIDADALTEEIRHAIKISESPWTHYGWAQKIVDDAQTVDPVKHGHWIDADGYYDNPYHGYGKGYYRCSCCNTVSWLAEHDKYCRCCGAKMDS